ncbi:MAG: ParB/RepB/Spo0J family partition protein [Oscillospiraceae bacterium]|nr:ParB/RepB/Spo0J family partition protein [Oscillospiraceae bacterium]
MKFDTINLGLTGYDELFLSSEEREDMKKPKVEEISILDLRPFKDHPFRVKEGEEMEQLKKSIHESGVLVPALARPVEDGYELISGHRRMAACAALGLETMPVIVREMTDEEAVIAMVDSNLQREHLLPSEKVFAYKMKMEALKHKAGRPEKNLSQVATNIDTAAEIGKSAGESRDQVFRYIRLTNLIPEILKMVDEERIALTPAVELSYLEMFEQNALYRIMERDDVTPSVYQAKLMRQLSREEKLNDAAIEKLISEPKANQKEYVRVPCEQLRRYFPQNATPKQMQETLLRAMDFYRQHSRAKTEREAR